MRWRAVGACGGVRWGPIFDDFSSLWSTESRKSEQTCQKTAIYRLHVASGQILLIFVTYVAIVHKYHQYLRLCVDMCTNHSKRAGAVENGIKHKHLRALAAKRVTANLF